MDQKLFQQRKDQLLYNQQINQSLKELCQPLFSHLKIKGFGRFTFGLDVDGKCKGLQGASTDLDFLTAYLFKFQDNGQDFTKAIRETSLDTYNYFLWPQGSACPMLQMYREEFDLAKGLSIFKRHKHSVETWYFATNHISMFPISVNEKLMAPFHEFIRYFDEKNGVIGTGPLIEYPKSVDMNFIPSKAQMEFMNYLHSTATSFSASPSLMINDQPITFSSREWDCLLLHGHGRTYKEIGKTLSLSPRTVEHYINHVKKKLGLHFKSELIDVISAHQAKNSSSYI